jgi:hypothetical protein
MLMYNPETIVKVSLMMVEAKIEFLITTRCYDMAASWLESNRNMLGSRSQYLVLKTQNCHMYSCLKRQSRDLLKLRALICTYLTDPRDKD